MIKERLYSIAVRLYPRLDRLAESERYAAAGYVWRTLVFIPPTLIGLEWLCAQTDPAIFREHGLFLIGLFGCMLLFSMLWLEIYFVTASGGYRSERRSFWGEAMWSGILVFGPTVGWLGVILPWVGYFIQRRGVSTVQRLRVLSQTMFRMSVLLPTLVEVAIYQRFGGHFPLPSLDVSAVLPAVIATLVGFTLGSLMITLSQGISRIMSPVSAAQRSQSLQVSVMMALIGPLAGLVAIIPAGLFTLAGWGGYFSFLAIMLFESAIVDRLSRTIENARRRTRELEELQRLSQSLLQTALDDAGLSGLLASSVPSVFPLCNVAVRIYPDQALLTLPEGWSGPDAGCWDWDPSRVVPLVLQPRDVRPWQQDTGREGIIVMPIIEPRSQNVLGRLYLHREERISTIHHLLPAVQWLADQIASARYSAELYRQTLDEQVRQERVAQELKYARLVQTSFLPTERPQIAGWQIAAVLEPARETSGDFYDIIPLHGGLIGIVIADVADKGVGAALFMALSRTLIRAYAIDYALRFAQTYRRQAAHLLHTVNSRIITDTKSDLFVTVFFGILDPQTGVLTYANAGHNPPMLFNDERPTKLLRRTGPPLGILDDVHWTRRTVKIDANGTLILYTDGLTEAMNANGEYFGDDLFQKTIRSCLDSPAEAMCSEILRAVSEFEGGTAHSDDITLLILRREKVETPEPTAAASLQTQ